MQGEPRLRRPTEPITSFDPFGFLDHLPGNPFDSDEHPEEATGSAEANPFFSPFGSDGIFTQIGEHIPFLNNGIQEMHKNQGQMDAYRRARTANPIGADGVFTQACEHIPLVCDGIEALHRYSGEHSAAERARARTLTRLLSKDGAVTKVAELIPGTNIVAAMMHEINGNREEAVRALCIFDNWTQVGEPDGPLAKVAELFPGMDVAAFAMHVSNLHYAQALRSITKTTWVKLDVDSVSVYISGSEVCDIEVSDSRIRKMQVEPRALSMVLGINEIFTKFLEVDKQGKHRPRSRSRFLHKDSPASRKKRDEKFQIVGFETEEWLSEWVNGNLRWLIARIHEDVPENVRWSMDCMNEFTFPRWRKMWRYYFLMHPTMPRPSAAFSKALQGGLIRGRLGHRPLRAATDCVVLPPLKYNFRTRVRRAAAATGAVGVAGCCGAKAAALTCFGGIMMGASSLSNYIFRALYNHYNDSNIECWDGGALRLDTGERPSAETHGVFLEMTPADSARLCQLVRDHVVENIRGGCLWAPMLRMMLPRLKAMFKRWGPEWETVPFVMDVETGDLNIPTPTWPDGLELPSLRVAIVCDLNIFGTGPSRVRVVVPDGLVDQFAQSTKRQMEEVDIRKQDPRFAGFTEPLKIAFDLKVDWPDISEAALELTNLRTTLQLPE